MKTHGEAKVQLLFSSTPNLGTNRVGFLPRFARARAFVG